MEIMNMSMAINVRITEYNTAWMERFKNFLKKFPIFIEFLWKMTSKTNEQSEWLRLTITI